MITIKKISANSADTKLIMALLIFILGFIAIAPHGAQAAIPRYINYQGKLTDAEDNPVIGDVSITIRIYDAESGGTALWTETQTVTVTSGIFSMLLGSTTTLTGLDFNSPYWYSIEIGTDGEMTPRQRVTSVAYAINADKLDGYDASQFLRADADTSLTGALTVSGNITGSANGDITLDPTGTGNILMKIDSTSGDFKVTDGTTNYVLVDSATGNVTMSNDLTVSGTIYGTIASTGGSSTFSSLTVTGASDLRGNVSNSTGALTIADALTQTGATNQVTFAGNVDAGNGLDVTGALTVSGAATLSSALDMNSNIDLDYSGTSAALSVTQASTGPAAQFAGGRVVIGANETTNAYALSTGELYVLGDLEVDGTIYGNVSSSGTTSLGDTTLASLTVTGTSDMKGNISNSTGNLTIADNLAVSKTDSSTSGTVTLANVQPTFQDGGTNSTTTAIGLNIAPTLNYTGATKTGSYTALKITATETSLPTGTNYLIDAYAGSDGTTQKFYVDNSGNAKIYGTLNMNSQKITSLATPTANTDAATKAYADSLTPASAGGWTDGGTGVYLISADDNVGIGTSTTDTYKLDVQGSINTTSLYIGGTQVTSTAAELNKVDGYTGTAANLNTLTNSANADSLHAHTASSLTGNVVSSIDGITNDGGDIDFVAGANMTITPNDAANTITFASSASGDETGTTNLLFTIDTDNAGAGVANGAGIVLYGGTGSDASIKFNSATNNVDIAGVTGGLNIPNDTNYKINGSQIASTNLSDTANIAMLNEAETIASNWVNTANPWADNEVADNITASNYLPLAGGTMSGDITLGTAGTNIVTAGIDLDLSPASGYGLTSAVTRSAATGDEVAYNLAATINKETSGNYTGIKLNVTETSAPGASDNLLDLQVGAASKFTVDNAGLITTASANSASVVNDSLTAGDLNVNVVSSIDGVTNDGGDIDLIAGSNITLTPNDAANTITIAATDTVLGQEGAEDYVGGMVSGNTETNIDVTYDDGGGKLNFAVTGVPVLAPASTQTIAAADTGATPLILKGMAGQTANLMEVQDSNALSHLTVEADGDVQIDTSGGDTLSSITQSNTSASLAIATNTAKLGGGAASDSDGVLKLGINEGNYQYIWYDTDAGTDGNGAFIFSDQAVIPTASPAYLNFGVNRDADTGRYSQYYAIKLDPDVSANSSYDKQKFSVVSIPTPGADFAKYEKPLFDISSDGSFNIYDPAVGDAVFQIQPGGRLAHDFRNAIKNGSFEAFSGFEKFVGYDPSFSQTGTYNNTTTGYRGGWSNFAPDEWVWVEGKIVQHSPALFKTGTGVTGTFNTDFFDGKSAVAINEWIGKRNLNYAIGSPESGNDAGVKQVITGLEPNTWYSIGVALMSTNPATTKAILDITGNYIPTTTITSGITQSAALNGTAASVISIASTANFPQGGTILIDNELFDYTGKTDTSFTNVTRGINSTTAASHANNAVVRGMFKPLVSSGAAFVENKGSFKTDSTGSDISIYLLCQQTSGANDTEFARFDAVQLVEGKVLPKYSASSITDTGDQSIYGTLKLGRSADGRGGILSVDQYVRTRGIDFFSEDPGMSGTSGGGGSVDRVPYSFVNSFSTAALPKTPGYVKMDVSGNYIAGVLRKFQVRVQGTYDNPGSPVYVKYRYIDCIDPMNEWSDSAWPAWTETWYPASPGIQVLTTDTDMVFGIKIRFSDTTGLKGGDQWEFKAYGMDPGQRVYDSFNKQTAYKSSETRIFRDPSTGELTFEDSNAGKVKLSEIISQRSKAYISPPTRDPSNMGTVEITATGELNSGLFSTAQNFEVWAEVVWDTNGNMILPPTKFSWSIMWTPNSGTTGTYTWYGNWSQDMNRGSEVSLIASTGQDTGIKVTFPSAGTINQYERWRFFASPSSAANVAAHHHGSDVDGGSLGAPGTTAQNFAIASATNPNDLDIKLSFGNAVSPDDKFLKWNKALNQFDFSSNVNITGTLTATGLAGPTSTSGTSNATFGVNTGIGAGVTEPAQGSGYIISGGSTGNVNIIYNTAGNYLDISGQTGATDTFTGLNIPTSAKYKIGGTNLTASDVGAANLSHAHTASDLPTAGDGIAGIIPVGGLTNAMVSDTAAIQTSKLQDGAGISDAITKKHTQGTDTALGTMAADINMGGNKVTNLGTPTTGSDGVTKTYVDNAIAGLHWKDPVIAIQTAPPAGPASGARYIINPTGTGAWNGQDNKIAVYNGATWDFTAPLQSYAVFNKADNAGYVYNGASWVAFSGATAYTWGTGLTNAGTTISIDNTIVATLTGTQTLTNKTISGADNTIQSISDGSLNQITTANKVAGTAVQLNAAGAITNSTGLKVNLTATNPGLAITDNTLDVKLSANQGLTKGANGMSVDYDDVTIGIVSNKLAVKGGSVGTAQITDSSITSADILDGTIANADISDTAAIAQSKINLAITNSEVAANAAITTSKLSGAVTSITNHGLGNLATLSAVSGGDAGTITDGTITNVDISNIAAIAQSKLVLSITNIEVAANAAIATSKISGPVSSIANHGLGDLATLNVVSGGAGGTITDNTITNDDIKSDAGILTSKLSGAVTSIAGHGLGNLATLDTVSGGAGGTITDATITTSDISVNAGILDSQLAISPATRFYENFAEYVESGLQPAVSANLTSNISSGTAYVRGVRINKTSATSKAYTASKDTYVDIDSSGNFQYTAVSNDAAAPSVAENSIRLAKVVTNGTAVTTVTDLRNLYPVTSNEIAPGAVTSTGIEDGSIGTAKLADSAVTSIKISDGTITNDDVAINAAIAQSKLALSITNNEVAAGAGIGWSKISKTGAVPTDVGAAASIHTHAATDLSGVVFTAPQSVQTIQPTADVVPLTIKGKASANSNVLSIYDAAATPSEKIYVDSAGHMRVAETTTGAAQASSATLYFGRNATDDWETIGYDPTLGTKGLFTFSAPLQVEASSPTGITFVEKDSQGAIIKSQGFMYDPTLDEFSFTGGTLKQAFQNLIKNPSFETSTPMGWMGLMNNYGYTISSNIFKFGTKSVIVNDNDASGNKGIKSMLSALDPDWKRLQGKTITMSFWAKADSSVTTSIGFDSTGTETDYNSSNEIVPEQANDIDLTATWQNFKFSYDVPASATKLNIILYGAKYSASGSNTYTQNIYFDGITLVEGKLALDYGPSPIFDTGSQVIYGSLAIGANYDPNISGNYYEAPRLIFGQPDSYFGGGYGGWTGGSGEIRFMKWDQNSVGTFMFNRSVWLRDDYGASYGATLRIGSSINPLYANYRGDIYAAGRLELGGQNAGSASLLVGEIVQGQANSSPTNATTANDAYVRGKIETDGGFYGDGSNLTGITGFVNLTGDTMTGDLTINQNSATPNDVYLAVQHNASNIFSVDKEGDVYVGGDLQVQGDQVILNVQTIEVESNNLVLNRNVTGSPVLNGMVSVERGDSPNTSLRWNESSDTWDITNDGTNYYAILNSNSTITTNNILNGTIVNADIAANASISQSKLNLAITNDEVSAAAAIATSKLSGPVTSIVNHGLGSLAALNTITTAEITNATITANDINATAGILDSQLATSPATRFYENFAEYVESGLQPATSANLTSNISLGTAYVRGARINKASATAKTYTANKDTYVDIDSSSAFQYTEVANGADAPSIAANSIRLAKVVTGAVSITSVTDLRNLYPVTSNEIAPGAVTSTGIEDGSISTAKLADSAVTSIKIADGTITNDDISNSAAIAGTKILSSFGSQNITTSGNIITTGAGVMTSAGILTASAGMNVSGGNIAITDASNIVLNTNKITLYGATGNAAIAGALTQLRSIGLTPDYDNAALNPDGSQNFGTLSIKYADSHNYYEWTTSEPSTQDYDIVIRYRLPDGFSSFDATTPIKLWNKVSATPGATKVDVTMLDTTGASVTLTGGSTLQNTSWTESTITIGGSPTFTAGGYVTITIKMSSDQAKTADAGELTLKGNW